MKKNIGKISGAIALMCTALLCGCAFRPEGYDEIVRARKLYEKLDSARLIMEDGSGELLMEFSFYINEDDEMIFSYRGKGTEGEELGYSTGSEFYYKSAGDEGWSVIGPADESYYYNIYTRKIRYPYARGTVFFLDGTSVSSAVISEEEGGTRISYVYDADKLNSYAAGQLENVDSFSGLTASYLIDGNGYITEFVRQGTATDADGSESVFDLKITVDSMNEIYEIPSPVDKLAEENN